jgi:predicted NAD/FAD-binding protein
LNQATVGARTLGEYLSSGRYGEAFIHDYLIPMGAAIWSASRRDMMGFPAASFLAFFRNHGLLSVTDRPQWRTVVGGSHNYLKAFMSRFRGKVETGIAIEHVRRTNDGAIVRMRSGSERAFDRVVLAAHADESLALLADPSDEESRILSAWRYQENRTVLHTDESAMPPLRSVWSSWNYRRETDGDHGEAVSLTYYMNRLQRLDRTTHYFVSLNRSAPAAPGSTIGEFFYTHPLYTQDAIRAQAELPRINGSRNTFFCGSYCRHGFHEDAVVSAVNVSRLMGLEL